MQKSPPPRAAASDHQRDMPSWWLAAVFISFVLVLAACIIPSLSRGVANPMASWQASTTYFNLSDDRGQPVTNQSWPGKYLLVYFGYTHCPDICPTALATMANALTLMGSDAKKVQPLFITVDPQRDTAPVLKAYTGLFSPRIMGLTGKPGDIRAAADNYGARYGRETAVSSGSSGGDYEMAHSGAIYLVYPSGALAATLPQGISAKALAASVGGRVN
jgi:protein SCO1/2